MKGLSPIFSVIFEVLPTKGHWDDYLANAKSLRPELEQVDGFVDNIRYKSLTREGWILSLSNWRDEKSLIRWRTHARHHEVQEKGRGFILADYHLRVGQITSDNQLPPGHALSEQRLDETEVGQGTAITLISATRSTTALSATDARSGAEWLGVSQWNGESTSWDIFDAVLTPGDLILLISWRNKAAAEAYASTNSRGGPFRTRNIRVVRDYGKYDRREAPQYYPDALGASTIHA
jgi:heme-degrading monooxygenase HmoA